MKGAQPFKVALSREALAVLDAMGELRTGDLIFPGQRHGKPLSVAALAKALRTAGAGKATTHGCRSTFKDWASERTTFADEVSEAALAHAGSDKTRAAYARSELLRKRAALMEAWAKFCTTPLPAANVVPIERRRKRA
jgi:integrase